ncbi:MAG: hypothetical protein Q8M31_21250 [Beijerinckiaceae bacterium]|nr:hypothetical protein [Beijerinckiaceae bacterium]
MDEVTTSVYARLNDDAQAKTIKQFCQAYQISSVTFHQMVRDGRGPEVLHFGKIVRIMPEAEREWLARRRAFENSKAGQLENARWREIAKRAAQKSVESPLHPMNRGKAHPNETQSTKRRRQQRG